MLRRQFTRLPPGVRSAILHAGGRFAPWEAGFDFSPPALAGEAAGPPDFVGIGVQKAGTTWWYELLLSTPGVAGRPDIHKERHFFDRFAAAPFGPADVLDYRGWFPRPPGTITGEWTPDYFEYPWVPPLLRQAAPEARLLLLLRDPVDRFRSGLAHQLRTGLPRDGRIIAEAVARGFYVRSLDRWQQHFDRDRILVLQYERCLTDVAGQLKATTAFLGLGPEALDVDHPPVPPRPSTPLDGELHARLVALYRSDVEALRDRLPDFDLSLWPNFRHLAR